jgi:hypothetical protein
MIALTSMGVLGRPPPNVTKQATALTSCACDPLPVSLSRSPLPWILITRRRVCAWVQADAPVEHDGAPIGAARCLRWPGGSWLSGRHRVVNNLGRTGPARPGSSSAAAGS